MKNNEPSYFAVIPANVRYCEKLTPNAKLLYGEITALTNKKGYCWSTNNYFAARYKKDKATISVWIKLLIDNNFIKITLKNNNKRRIYLIDPLEKSKGTPLEKSNGLYNNTSINNIARLKNASLRKKKPAALLFDKESSIYKKLLLKLKDNIITKRNLTNYTINFTSWFKEIHKLRKQGISKDRLIQTLKWYIKHYNENYVPVIFNARDFGSKYFKIEDAMSRSNQTNNAPVKTVLSKTAKKLINIIKSDHLSLNCVDLDYCVQTSVDNFNQYLKWHSYLQDNTKGRLKAFIKHFDMELPDIKNYLEHWFDKAISKVCNWSDWNGSLVKHIFTIDSREFNNFGCSVSTEYCGDNLLWQKYMKALKKGQI